MSNPEPHSSVVPPPPDGGNPSQAPHHVTAPPPVPPGALGGAPPPAVPTPSNTSQGPIVDDAGPPRTRRGHASDAVHSGAHSRGVPALHTGAAPNPRHPIASPVRSYPREADGAHSRTGLPASDGGPPHPTVPRSGAPHPSEHPTTNGKNLIVNYLPADMDENELKLLFGRCGSVKKVKIVADKATGQSRCYGFVLFTSNEDAVKAIAQFNGYAIRSRKLKVNIAHPRSRARQHANLYVANIPLHWQERQVRDVFSRHGSILSVKLVRQKTSMKFRGVAFVRFHFQSDALAAVAALNDQESDYHDHQTQNVEMFRLQVRTADDTRPGKDDSGAGDFTPRSGSSGSHHSAGAGRWSYSPTHSPASGGSDGSPRRGGRHRHSSSSGSGSGSGSGSSPRGSRRNRSRRAGHDQRLVVGPAARGAPWPHASSPRDAHANPPYQAYAGAGAPAAQPPAAYGSPPAAYAPTYQPSPQVYAPHAHAGYHMQHQQVWGGEYGPQYVENYPAAQYPSGYYPYVQGTPAPAALAPRGTWAMPHQMGVMYVDSRAHAPFPTPVPSHVPVVFPYPVYMPMQQAAPTHDALPAPPVATNAPAKANPAHKGRTRRSERAPKPTASSRAPLPPVAEQLVVVDTAASAAPAAKAPTPPPMAVADGGASEGSDHGSASARGGDSSGVASGARSGGDESASP